MIQHPISKRDSVVVGSAAAVCNNTVLCSGHYALDLIVRGFPRSTPGQFVQILCAEHDSTDAVAHTIDWPDGAFPYVSHVDFRQRTAFIRRPFSIADRWTASDGSDHVSIIHHDIGPGTHWLAELRPGDSVDLSGPFGRGFELPDLPVTCVLIGGGVGIPPLIYLSRALAERPELTCIAFMGARSRGLLPLRIATEPPNSVGTPRPCVILADEVNVPAIVTSDDGSIGVAGRVTDALRAWLAQREPSPSLVAFACGPEPMLRSTAHLTREFGIPTQLCIERLMGCGLGTCLSCAVKIHDPARTDGWRFALTCQDGPVFPRDTLVGA